jgi:hypothetical protein
VFSAFFQLTIWALFLQGMLQVQAILANPFGRGRLDFPSRAFHRYIRNEALSFLVAAEEFETAHPSFSKHKLHVRRAATTSNGEGSDGGGGWAMQQQL